MLNRLNDRLTIGIVIFVLSVVIIFIGFVVTALKLNVLYMKIEFKSRLNNRDIHTPVGQGLRHISLGLLSFKTA